MVEMKRIEALAKRLAKLEAIKAIEEQPLVLASGLSISISGADLARLFREVTERRGVFPQANED
jgi:hypothetical protein